MFDSAGSLERCHRYPMGNRASLPWFPPDSDHPQVASIAISGVLGIGVPPPSKFPDIVHPSHLPCISAINIALAFCMGTDIEYRGTWHSGVRRRSTVHLFFHSLYVPSSHLPTRHMMGSSMVMSPSLHQPEHGHTNVTDSSSGRSSQPRVNALPSRGMAHSPSRASFTV